MKTATILGDQWIVNGSVSANFHLVAYDDNGNEMMRSNPHTVTAMPDSDLDATLVAINADITTRKGMLWPPIQQADWDRIKAHCGVEFTPSVVAAYEEFKATQLAAAPASAVAAQPPAKVTP